MSDEKISTFRDNPPGLTVFLNKSSVGITGVGGVGSNVAASLTRAGIGRIVMADFDSVELPNLNRQFYFRDQIGYPKVEALRYNLKLINPDADIEIHNRLIDSGNACSIFGDCDVLVEAVDREETKIMLLESWLCGLPRKPVFSCSGIAGFGRTDSIRVDRRQNLTIVGDQESDLSLGTLSSRVAIVAAMMANEIIEYLVGPDATCAT
ncbi:MAG: sulfur carrier protein ThiS adenylyltransferase ThiF [Candidatus Aegiribacteria sp.]|nr:sulfur carrier protein ThiS adenylyltransferase ThiF [Candidatus Aegiribacteria sp.]